MGTILHEFCQIPYPGTVAAGYDPISVPLRMS